MRKGGAAARLQSAYDEAIQRVADLTLQVANAAARAETAELREGEVRKHVDDLKGELGALVNLHKAEQEQSSQLRQEITRMQARLEQASEDTAALHAEVAAVRTAATAANERAVADAAKASAEIKALTVACDDARRHANGTVRAGRAPQRRAGRRSAAGGRLSRPGQASGRRLAIRGGTWFEEPCQLSRLDRTAPPHQLKAWAEAYQRDPALYTHFPLTLPNGAQPPSVACVCGECGNIIDRELVRGRVYLVTADRCYGRGDGTLQTLLAHHPNPLSVSGGWGQLYRRVAG